MRRGRGRAGVAGCLVLLAAGVLALAVARRAAAFMRIPMTDSLEAQVASADLVIYGRILAAPESPMGEASPEISVRVIDVLRGDQPVEADLRVPPYMDRARLAPGTEGLFVLRRIRTDYVAIGGPEGAYVKSVRVFGVDAASAWLWEPPARTYLAGTEPAYTMDGRALATPDELTAAARVAASFPTTPAERLRVAYLVAGKFPPASRLARVPKGILSVPVDGRLEHMAHAWLDESDVRYRAQAAEVLAYFPSTENRRRLRALLHDPGYELAPAGTWEPIRDRRVMRKYVAREAALTALVQLGMGTPVDLGELTAPHRPYVPLVWVAVLLAIMGTTTAALTAGRRGGVLRRLILCGFTAAAAWVMASGVRSYRLAESVGWSAGGASYEILASGGRAWLLRVADGSGAAAVAVRSEHVTGADGQPWFAPMLNASNAVGAVGTHFERGVISQPSYAYQMVTAPLWMLAAVPALVPAWAAGSWWLGRARRIRRRRRGRCAACGYDLRGLTDSRRCPECGALGRVRVAAKVMALIALAVGPAARGEGKAEPSVEWLVEQAHVIVRGEIVAVGPPNSLALNWVATIRTAESIKGQAPPRVSVVLPDWVATNVLQRGMESPHPIEAVAFLAHPATGIGTRGTATDEWTPVEPRRSVFVSGWIAAVSMDGRRDYDFRGLLAMTREAVRYAAARGRAVPEAVLWPEVPPAREPMQPPPPPPPPPPPIPRVGGRLLLGSNLRQIGQPIPWYDISGTLVPQDARLEALARDWMDRPDAGARFVGLRAIRWFRSPQAERRVRELLADEHFNLWEPEEWAPALPARGRRFYRVREEAISVLGAWEIRAPQVAVQESHPFYAPVSLSRLVWIVPLVLLGGIMIAVRRRWSLGTSAAAVCAVLALAGLWLTVRSGRVRESFSAARGGVDWELTIGGGRLGVLRVEDGAPPHGWQVRRENTTSPNPQPWYARYLKPGESGGGRAVAWERGVMGGKPGYAYRRWDASGAAMVTTLAAWPGAWACARTGRTVRRRRWRATGRCGACGYDLRGSPAGGRCPECGAITTR